MTSKRNPESPETHLKEVKYWTFKELNEIKDEKSWMIYGDSVYNVKPFIPYHPGGELLIKHLLYTDVTDHLGKFHPKYVTEEKLPQYFMGKIDEKTFPPLTSRSEVSQDFILLEARMEKEGLFNPCYFYYIREFTKVFFFWYMAISIIVSGPDTVLPVVFAAVL